MIIAKFEKDKVDLNKKRDEDLSKSHFILFIFIFQIEKFLIFLSYYIVILLLLLFNFFISNHYIFALVFEHGILLFH